MKCITYESINKCHCCSCSYLWIYKRCISAYENHKVALQKNNYIPTLHSNKECCLSVCLPLYLSASLSTTLSVCLPLCLFACLSVYLCLPLSLSVYLPACIRSVSKHQNNSGRWNYLIASQGVFARHWRITWLCFTVWDWSTRPQTLRPLAGKQPSFHPIA